MDRLNQILAALFGAVVLACGVAVSLGALFVAGPYSLTLSTGEQWTVYRLSPTDQTIGVILGLVLGLLGLFVCALIMLGSPRAARLIIRRQGPNRIAIETAAAMRQVQDAVEMVDGVVQVDVRLLAGRRAVTLMLNVLLDPAAQVSTVSATAEQCARDVLEQNVGLPVRAVSTTVRYRGGSERATPATRLSS